MEGGSDALSDHGCPESYDAIVVGSGYGGSVAACRMSLAGINVCLIEKGKRWEAEDFPKNTFGLMSAARMEWSRWGIGFGSKKALFQMCEQGDSFIATACGLGGGSLINAGVMASTPVRARRDPKWPKEWEKDWEVCEQSASTMLGSQSVPIEFANTRVMTQITEEENEEYKSGHIKLSVNFDTKEAPNPTGSQKMESCLACGNCLSGCRYNAKNSTDKNYLASAIQAGCVVKTECEVLYILKHPNQDCGEYYCSCKEKRRRWRVYFDNLEYACTDFIVLSSGVVGTTKIMFQSQMRGLRFSERLGYGLSCNGNNVAYVAGSQAPLNAYGLTKDKLSKIPFKDRPGPSISSSYISSLGFTIQISESTVFGTFGVQSAVLPTAYPYMLFKGIVTYGWPTGFWLLHGLIDKMKNLLGLKASQSMVLNVMGFDECNGRITLNNGENVHIIAPHDPLLPKKIRAFQNLTKRLGGIMFMSRYRSTSVHLLGGCNAALNSSNGVCNSEGQVFDSSIDKTVVHEGLYVCDASVIPCSIGINPCLTIATVAEHVSKCLVHDILRFKRTVQHNQHVYAGLKGKEERHDTKCDAKVIDSGPSFENSRNLSTIMQSHKESLTKRIRKKVTVRETMRGFIGGMPCTAYLVMKMSIWEPNDDDEEPHPLLKGRVSGFVVFQAIEKDKLYIIDGEVDMCKVDKRSPYTQYMYYKLLLSSASGSRYILEGKKVMNPYLLASYAWRESRTLYVTFKTLYQFGTEESKGNKYMDDVEVDLHGELHLSMIELLRSLITLKGKQKISFVRLLLQSLWRTYILQVPRQSKVDSSLSNMTQTSYPPSILHELRTEDGCIISCHQWSHINDTLELEKGRKHYPVLLLNGHSIESYSLPSEPRDLVRTLSEEGYETWLLYPRVHPSHPSNNFTIEDIGRFDIPAVIRKILELNGPDTRIHVIAHCVGGLAIHVALLGGYISAAHIASLSCTNSSMYFKLTTSSLVKMKLPLIPVSMAILGENRVLSMHDDAKDSTRHRILKTIARLIPRYERCTTNECEVFSGIFGNAFWHDNISSSMHTWLNKLSLTQLPMSAFPHLRKICISGFIVDPKGQNTYLIHPERMSVSTLYISGGRILLATPETSLLANKYMRLHQPGFHHKRVVVEGFGHSDLLIGEESYQKVFPHFISHMRLAEREGTTERIKNKETMISWDGSHDGNTGSGGWISVIYFLFFIFISLLYISLG